MSILSTVILRRFCNNKQITIIYQKIITTATIDLKVIIINNKSERTAKL